MALTNGIDRRGDESELGYCNYCKNQHLHHQIDFPSINVMLFKQCLKLCVTVAQFWYFSYFIDYFIPFLVPV